MGALDRGSYYNSRTHQRVLGRLDGEALMAARWIGKNIYAAIFAIFIVGPIAWLVMDRTPPFEIYDGHTVPTEIRYSEPFTIEWKYKNLPRQCPGTIYSYMIDSKGKVWVFRPSQASFGLIEEDIPDGSLVSGNSRKLPESKDDLHGRPASGRITFHFTMDFICNFTQWFWPLRVRAPVVHSVIVE